ncbi:MAG TPA: hypothetical protein DIU15_07220 [Deltaproteobacteria bacterium]|nr:hypothetical protein [Deltaproteobacteria bacterium]
MSRRGRAGQKVVTVSFAPLGTQSDCVLDKQLSREADLSPGAQVVVRGMRGLSLARIIAPPHRSPDADKRGRARRVVRVATAGDLSLQRKAEAEEPRLFRRALESFQHRQLPFKLVRVAADGLGKKITLCFVAEERADTKALVPALERDLDMQVELRQLGPRDEARTLGGLGRCGRPLCCSSFLPRYPRVSIKMAKAQGLSLAEGKTDGVCGRTLCCLAYENDFYVEQSQWLPRLMKRARTTDGLEGKVVGIDVLKLQFTLLDEHRRRHVLTARDWEGNEGKEVPAAQVSPSPCESPVQTESNSSEVVTLPSAQQPARKKRRRRRKKRGKATK